MAWAVNNSGQMVCGPGGGENETSSASIYQIGTGALTPLAGLLFSYPKPDDIPNYGGFQDCINSSGQVVGYEVVGGVNHAAIWQNGNLIDLQAEYAGILPSGFVLNNATAISDNGYIAGSDTDGSGHVVQAFRLQLMPGDANLDGRVDINDLTSVLTNYGKTVGVSWNAGDFNADGKVDINDLTVVLTNYGHSLAASAVAGGVSAVPEPGMLALVFAAGLLGLLACVRRHRTSS
jgi:probable HAF family extracellular repeat protein